MFIIIMKIALYYVKRMYKGFIRKAYIPDNNVGITLELETGIILFFITGECQYG